LASNEEVALTGDAVKEALDALVKVGYGKDAAYSAVHEYETERKRKAGVY